MRFAVLGPYRVPTVKGSREIDFNRTYEVFDEARSEALARNIDIDRAIGLYVLGLSPSGSPKTYPYYVGQARLQTIAKRAFQKSDKVAKYRSVMQDCGYVKASPFIYLLPLLTATGRLARLGSNKAIIDEAEYTLIGMGRVANYDLWNVKHRVGMDAFSIDGVFNGSGRAPDSARAMAAMFGAKTE